MKFAGIVRLVLLLFFIPSLHAYGAALENHAIGLKAATCMAGPVASLILVPV